MISQSFYLVFNLCVLRLWTLWTCVTCQQVINFDVQCLRRWSPESHLANCRYVPYVHSFRFLYVPIGNTKCLPSSNTWFFLRFAVLTEGRNWFRLHCRRNALRLKQTPYWIGSFPLISLLWSALSLSFCLIWPLHKILHFSASLLCPWRWMQYIFSKRWRLLASLYDVGTQNIVRQTSVERVGMSDAAVGGNFSVKLAKAQNRCLERFLAEGKS
jgi:hypothetical protein